MSRFKDAVSQDEDAVKKFAADLRKIEAEHDRHLLRTMLLELYDGDVDSLKRDLLKVQVLGTAKVMPTQRAVLLRCIYPAVPLYIQNDFDGFLASFDNEGGAAVFI